MEVDSFTPAAAAPPAASAAAVTAAAPASDPTPGVDRVPVPPLTRPSAAAGACTITEGAAVISFPSRDAVFYNRVQIMNRDLSISVIRTLAAQRQAQATERDRRKAWMRRAAAESAGKPAELASVPPRMPGLRVLEALAASGLRSVRYAREVEDIDTLVVNDLDAAAVAALRNNLAVNGLIPADASASDAAATIATPLEGFTLFAPRVIQPSHADAIALMYRHRDGSGSGTELPFDVVDLDPYGTAVPFLDTAVAAVMDGGLLCVTCTDMAVLAGNNMDSCFTKYGSMPVRAKHYAEQALRIVLAAIESAANRHKRSITPLLSLSIDFYVRVFVRVHASPDAALLSPLKVGSLYQCSACDAFWSWPAGRQTPKPAASRADRKAARASAGAAAGGVTAGHKRTRKDAGVDATDVEAADVEVTADASAAAAGAAAPSSKAPTSNVHWHPTTFPRDAYATAAPPVRALAEACGASLTAADAVRATSSGRVHANVLPGVGSTCPCCGSAVHVAGPVWLDPIHDPEFVRAVLARMTAEFGEDGCGVAGAQHAPTCFYDLSRHAERDASDSGSNDVPTVAVARRRIMGLVRSAAEELPDVPLYYDLASICSRIHATGLSIPAVSTALRAAGFRVSGSHATTNVIKTDAPPAFVWDVVRAWEQLPGNAVSSKHRDNVHSLAHKLLNAPAALPELRVSFEGLAEEKAAAAAAKAAGPRHIPNPDAGWGPGSRASAAKAASAQDKRAAAAADKAAAKAAAKAHAAPLSS